MLLCRRHACCSVTGMHAAATWAHVTQRACAQVWTDELVRQVMHHIAVTDKHIRKDTTNNFKDIRPEQVSSLIDVTGHVGNLVPEVNVRIQTQASKRKGALPHACPTRVNFRNA